MTMCTYFGTVKFIIILWALNCLQGFCPIFTNDGYLQWSPCRDTACPNSSYRSDQVYKYQICYRKTDYPKGENTEKGSKGKGTTIVVIVLLSLFFIVIVILVVFYKRNQFGLKEKVQQCITGLRSSFRSRNLTHASSIEEDIEFARAVPLLHHDTEVERAAPDLFDGKHDETQQFTKKLQELLKYLNHILEQELDVNDLKEKAVLHSKSMKEHFTELIIKDLQNLKEANDYGRLDPSLVFALLRNFCDGIKPPKRGWDYEPPDDETHVGADIERIRSMWNKRCDNDFQFKHLDQVYNRMKEKYGTIAVLGDDSNRKPPHKDEENAEGSTLMLKVQSVTLNPDCIVEKGNVITENIISALKILQSSNVVILKGVIGCGKTHALMTIENHYKGTKWETKWVEFQNIKGEISKEKPTILLCDNLFGRFGSCVFSQDAINETEKVLKDIEYSKPETKIVIGIHTHVYDEIKKSLKLNFLHQRTITVEMDNLSNAETLLIFKEQLKKGHCKKDANCWFKSVGYQSVLDKLSKNHQGHIGGPFLSLMYCSCHELFSDAAFSVNPVRSLMQHIERVSHDSPSVYSCLVYLMCVQQHNIKAEPKRWVGLISIDITKHSIMDLAQTSGLINVENEIASPAHELLTIILFKSAAQKREIVIPVLQVCERDIFLQLLRPTDSAHSDLNFEYKIYSNLKSMDDISRDIEKLCAYILANMYKKPEINHPLMKEELVNEKYLRYLHVNHKPKWLVIIDNDLF